MSKPIYVLCLHNVRTGGPEAIHQLSDALIEQGFDARMVYYDWEQIAVLEQASPQDGYHFGARENPIEEYARYKVKVTDHVPNTQDMVVVLPETLCHLAPKFDNATVLIWWLSVDNGFGALAKVNLNHLRREGVQHAAQSVYANRFIADLGLTLAPGAFLSDYTVDLSEYATPLPWRDRPWIVLFNANHKVTEDVGAIMRELSEFQCEPLIGTRQEVAEKFATARAYVDLGCFPGKDRAPREAVLMGCVPFVAPVGAGWTDMPHTMHLATDDYLKRSTCKTLRSLRSHDNLGVPESELKLVQGERWQFFREVKAVFSDL